MTEITLDLTHGDFDAFENASGVVTLDGTAIQLTTGNHWAGLGFLNAPNDLVGATINSATLRIYIVNTTNDDVVLDVYLEKAANSIVYTTATSDISSRTRTTAKASVNATAVGAGWYEITGLGPAVAEVVALPFWDNSSDLFPILDALAGCSVGFRTYDFDPALAPELVIDYTPAAAGGQAAIGRARLVPGARRPHGHQGW